MLNLLLKEQKNKIKREYRLRFTVVVLALALTAELIALILLVPSYLIAKTRIEILKSESVDTKVKNINEETTNLSETVRKTSGYLTVLSSTSTLKNISDLINEITGARGNIKLINLSYKVVNNLQNVVIIGTAPSRQSLMDFLKKIRALPKVTSADLPVSDFAQSENLEFSLTIVFNLNS